MAQVTDGRTVTSDLELECEVVVVGTGAGGAAAAYELAKRGRAVLLLEGGHYPVRTELPRALERGLPKPLSRARLDHRARQRRGSDPRGARRRREHDDQLGHLLPRAGAHARALGRPLRPHHALARSPRALLRARRVDARRGRGRRASTSAARRASSRAARSSCSSRTSRSSATRPAATGRACAASVARPERSARPT